MLAASRWTVHRRVAEYGLQNMTGYDDLPDERLDQIIQDYINSHGSASGCNIITCYLKSAGLQIQRRRVRETLAKLDPENNALRWGATIQRRKYQVPWSNSLWHPDGHHSLIRWKVEGGNSWLHRRIF